jgi:hypothetical protein
MTKATAAMTELEKQRKVKIEQDEKEQALMEAAIPKPTGYHILDRPTKCGGDLWGDWAGKGGQDAQR